MANYLLKYPSEEMANHRPKVNDKQYKLSTKYIYTVLKVKHRLNTFWEKGEAFLIWIYILYI